MKTAKKILFVLLFPFMGDLLAQQGGWGPPPPPGVPLGTNELLLIAIAIVLLYFFAIRSRKNITRP